LIGSGKGKPHQRLTAPERTADPQRVAHALLLLLWSATPNPDLIESE